MTLTDEDSTTTRLEHNATMVDVDVHLDASQFCNPSGCVMQFSSSMLSNQTVCVCGHPSSHHMAGA